MPPVTPAPQRYLVNHTVPQQHNAEDNGLFARKKLEKGELILQLERPMLTALDIDILRRACEWCFAFTEPNSLSQQEGRKGEYLRIDTEQQQGLPEGKATTVQRKQEVKRTLVKLDRCGGCKVVWFCGKVGKVFGISS